MTAASSDLRARPCCLARRPASPLSSQSASRNISLAMNWSPRFCASLSVMLSRLARSRPMETSPPWPSTLGSRVSACSRSFFSAGTLTPARESSERVPPSSWLINASNRCGGSMNCWSLPTARLWASASACWNLVVNLSMRIGVLAAGFFDTPQMRPPAGISTGGGEARQPSQRAAAASSVSRASTQRAPSGVASRFQNGARVFR